MKQERMFFIVTEHGNGPTQLNDKAFSCRLKEMLWVRVFNLVKYRVGGMIVLKWKKAVPLRHEISWSVGLTHR